MALTMHEMNFLQLNIYLFIIEEFFQHLFFIENQLNYSLKKKDNFSALKIYIMHNLQLLSPIS